MKINPKMFSSLYFLLLHNNKNKRVNLGKDFDAEVE